MIPAWIRERRLPWEEVARPPRLPSLWLTVAWIGFLAGVSVVIFSMLAIGGEADAKAGAQVWLFWVMFPAFVVASLHTVLAALGFSFREASIRRELEQKIEKEWRLTEDGAAAAKTTLTHRDKDGRLGFELRAQAGNATGWHITVGTGYLPKPFWVEDPKYEVRFNFTEFVVYLGAETHAARTSAAKLAAAYGGLFLAAVNVFGRLVA